MPGVCWAQSKWYIPHHGVFNPHKPKLRVVFDCAARSQGIALNDVLIPGPTLTNSLLGVLLRFRECKVALMADVEAMFYQVRVPEKDRHYLRFLWFTGGNLEKEPEEFRMKVHLFGVASSRACANSALKQTAEDGENSRNSEAVKTIQNNFYGGFNLTKWSSSDKQVIESIPKERRSKELQSLNFKEDGLPLERALGVNWSPEGDILGFSPLVREYPLTKRGFLATLSSVFDPMGLVAPVILPARLVLQESIKRVNGWDDPIPDDLLKR
ncbi:uncharacterized protein [Antedon mediterranea]|uniref:uncharacterized protein n=1 Tax=Antedon mediterranea TaxID=105859 RepID=UPI003AF567F0